MIRAALNHEDALKPYSHNSRYFVKYQGRYFDVTKAISDVRDGGDYTSEQLQGAIISEVNSAIKALKDSKSLSDWAKRTEISNFENQKQNKNTQNYGTENYKPTDEFRRVQEASRKFLEQGVSKFQRKEEEFNNEDRGRLGGVLGRQLESASHDGRYDFKSDLTHTNKNGSVGHFKVGRVDGQLFHDIFEVVRTYLPHGELVDLHDDYSNAKCFITDDGLCGFAVEPDGNLVSVFSLSPDTNKGFLYAINPTLQKKRNFTDFYLDFALF